jgi:DNA-binding transcriptional MerR regulator
MVGERTYSIDELERETGVDRRTIAYYVQEGLLPKIGRRGPKTRYPRLFRDRLLFISQLRELQDSGRIGTMTLADIRGLFATVPDTTIAAVAEGRDILEAVDLLGVETAESPPAMAMPMEDTSTTLARHSRRLSGFLRGRSKPEQEPAVHADIPRERPEMMRMLGDARGLLDEDGAFIPRSSSVMSSLGQETPGERLAGLLHRIKAASGKRRHREPGTAERWSRVEIGPGFAIEARDLTPQDEDLLEEAARAIREMIGEE